jgi:haloalkane dehalogenase
LNSAIGERSWNPAIFSSKTKLPREAKILDRRRFLQMSIGSVPVTALGGHGHQLPDDGSTALSSKEITALEFAKTRQFVTTDSGRIAYIERGQGNAALLLHGFFLNSFQWRGVMPRVSVLRRCVAPDFMALGYTEVAEGQAVTPNAQVAMLVQFLDKLSISAVDVVANDSGGAVAQLFVSRYPKRVRTLLLTNCDTEPDSPPAAVLPVIELARVGKFADQWLAPWLADKALARSEKGLGGLCYANPAHPTDDAIETYLAPLLSSPQRKAQTNAYATGLAPNPLMGIEDALKRCAVPTRIVWGTGDNIFSQASADYLDRTFAKSRGVRRVIGAKLFFPEEMPELIAGEAKQLWGH